VEDFRVERRTFKQIINGYIPRLVVELLAQLWVGIEDLRFEASVYLVNIGVDVSHICKNKLEERTIQIHLNIA
jgi:hypothetical protein